MGLVKSKGNMYPWVTHMKSFIGGQCPHECKYCYVETSKKRWPKMMEMYSGQIRMLPGALEENIGTGKTIFVQHNGDLFARGVPRDLIEDVLKYCRQYDNEYLFQSKNPGRFHTFAHLFPKQTMLATTIESNRDYGEISKAPDVFARFAEMCAPDMQVLPRVLTLEPLLDFDVDALVRIVQEINPIFVNIGADSKGHGLPEPPAWKVQQLLARLKSMDVRVKDNLGRLLSDGDVLGI